MSEKSGYKPLFSLALITGPWYRLCVGDGRWRATGETREEVMDAVKLTDSQITEGLRLAGEATPGPWEWRDGGYAELIASIYHRGNFKAETHNERTLEALLRQLGHWPYTPKDGGQ